jgi:hypothetical protein
MIRRLPNLILNFLFRIFKSIVNFVYFIFRLMLVLFLFTAVVLFCIYIYNLNKNNFLNQNKLENIEAVEIFLDTILPSEETSREEIMMFIEEQKLTCQTYRNQENTANFSGTINCKTDITNPAFYGVRTLPSKLVATAWDSITDDSPYLRIIFWIERDSLQDIELQFYRAYL